MPGVKLNLTGWEDGEQVEKDVEVTWDNRWELHSATDIVVSIDDIQLKLVQQPNALNANRIGVGACVWEGELLLCAYLASLPRHRFQGAHCVELGSGPGLAGLLVAKLGGIAHITDKDVVLDLAQRNVELNGLSREQRKGAATGWAEVSALEWGKEGYEEQAASLASLPLEFVFAADTIYIDQESLASGKGSPSTTAFINTLRILSLSPSKPRCFVSFELRAQQIKEVFLEEAGQAFGKVYRVPPSELPAGCRPSHIELYEVSH